MASLKALDRAWGGVLWVLMALTAVYIGLMMIGIVYITLFRTFGWSYFGGVHTFIEYGFIYCLFMGSPWLIRNRSHIYIELLTAAVSDRIRDGLSRLIALICCVFCLAWTWYTWGLFAEHWGDVMAFDELRDQEIRRWITTIAFPIGFLLMAIEFGRFVVVAEPMHIGEAGVASDRAELEETKRALGEDR